MITALIIRDYCRQATYVVTRCVPIMTLRRAVLSHTFTTLSRLRRHPTKVSLRFADRFCGDDRSNLVIVAEELWLQKTLALVVPTQATRFAERFCAAKFDLAIV